MFTVRTDATHDRKTYKILNKKMWNYCFVRMIYPTMAQNRQNFLIILNILFRKQIGSRSIRFLETVRFRCLEWCTIGAFSCETLGSQWGRDEVKMLRKCDVYETEIDLWSFARNLSLLLFILFGMQYKFS